MIEKNNKYPWDKARVILVCGSGGVGKTTLSAAIAIDFAKRGFKTIAITVDPAVRLAQCMGLNKLSCLPQKIKLPGGKNAKPGGSLNAMMLDTKRMFDSIVEKYAPDEKVRKNILSHPLYDHLSKMIAGSQEYMAMENLYKIVNQYNYEKIIVDTPPAHHALDFIDAPKKMVNALTNSMLKMLVMPSIWAGRKGSKFLGFFSKMTSTQFLQELSDFLSSTVSLLSGFKERAEEVMRLIESEQTGMVLVTAPTIGMISDSVEFMRSIKKRDMEITGCIINRVTPEIAPKPEIVQAAAEWCKKNKNLADLGNAITAIEKNIRNEAKLLSGLKRKNPKTSIFRIDKTYKPMHNLNGLRKLFLKIQPI